MKFAIYFLAAFITLVSVLFQPTAAAPTEVQVPRSSDNVTAGSDLEVRGGPIHHGRATWFTLDGLEVACGGWYNDYDSIVALPFWRRENCFRTVKIEAGGITKYAKAVDSCPTCAHYQLDMSVGLFQDFKDLDIGIFDITWHFVD
ncbi:hypothetical protein A4X13_0g160 [Tilletia indica]|uniref:RlpA-like protein double-psi beta-barrel domain-containing protein n=1 Tax=Tilletia indica TaxID=43049 RepID=A0A177TN27_9BASI|nr:hypothetical protein A4X13_0g160 [Tilletia indica]